MPKTRFSIFSSFVIFSGVAADCDIAELIIDSIQAEHTKACRSLYFSILICIR